MSIRIQSDSRRIQNWSWYEGQLEFRLGDVNGQLGFIINDVTVIWVELTLSGTMQHLLEFSLILDEFRIDVGNKVNWNLESTMWMVIWVELTLSGTTQRLLEFNPILGKFRIDIGIKVNWNSESAMWKVNWESTIWKVIWIWVESTLSSTMQRLLEFSLDSRWIQNRRCERSIGNEN